MKSIEVPAEKKRLHEVISFISEYAHELGFGKKEIFNLAVCVEEIFVNVASYAYYPDTGMISITAEGTADPVSIAISFIDSGKPFDPLAKPDPQKNRPFAVAKKGGLGILITKRLMNEVSYEYKDGKNIFTMKMLLNKNAPSVTGESHE